MASLTRGLTSSCPRYCGEDSTFIQVRMCNWWECRCSLSHVEGFQRQDKGYWVPADRRRPAARRAVLRNGRGEDDPSESMARFPPCCQTMYSVILSGKKTSNIHILDTKNGLADLLQPRHGEIIMLSHTSACGVSPWRKISD